MLRKANAGARPFEMILAIANGLMGSKATATEVVSGHCEVAERLAVRLGFTADVVTAVGQSEERWDGRGLPDALKGEAIVPAVRVVNLARDFIVLSAALGAEAAEAKLRERRGRAYDPRIVDLFLKRSRSFTGGFEAIVSWDEVLRLEPEPQVAFSDGEVDAACLAMADFADIKSPFTNGHSRAVAALATEAARRAGLPGSAVADLGRAAHAARYRPVGDLGAHLDEAGAAQRAGMGGGAAPSLLWRAHPVAVAGAGSPRRPRRRAS